MKGFRRLGRAFKRNENGSAALIVGPAMVALLGVTSVSVDTMNAFTAKEQLLTTAQAAASAAASVMPDRNKAAEAALTYAEANLKGAPPGTVVTYEDIQFGNWDKATHTFTPAGAGDAANAIRVTASRTSAKGNAVPTIFGRVLGIDSLGDMSMSATASRFDGLPCINALADSGKGLTLSSKAKIEMGDCPVHVQSTSSDALTLDSTAKITAEEVCLNGGYVRRSSNEVTPEPGMGCTTVAQDPFVNLPPPPTSSDSCLFTNKPPINGELLGLIQNAVYCGGLHITGNSTVVLPPGVYTIRGGKLKVDAGSTLMGEGVTIYLTGNDTVLDFSDSANINLSAPTEGPHAGILFFQDRNYGGQHNLSSNVNATLDGALYFPAGTLNVNGNSTVSAASSCLMIVADSINIDTKVTGDSASTVTAPNSSLCPPSPYVKRSVVVM
ncbi:TadG family pilus assembly protein [Microvirga sp. CF3062]|uniref:TadG family pilus assembly protein n=1 Tax=Microvirga sp. CF3062 TaxID=3110182 RepID=UPI002E7951C2|nr:TadG family pilus assembly protein [Microvirga sp. CF3062]MEE1656956.1 TadG family pilus assembly protein [Microvirga sp. CF3062]